MSTAASAHVRALFESSRGASPFQFNAALKAPGPIAAAARHKVVEGIPASDLVSALVTDGVPEPRFYTWARATGILSQTVGLAPIAGAAAAYARRKSGVVDDAAKALAMFGAGVADMPLALMALDPHDKDMDALLGVVVATLPKVKPQNWILSDAPMKRVGLIARARALALGRKLSASEESPTVPTYVSLVCGETELNCLAADASLSPAVYVALLSRCGMTADAIGAYRALVFRSARMSEWARSLQHPEDRDSVGVEPPPLHNGYVTSHSASVAVAAIIANTIRRSRPRPVEPSLSTMISTALSAGKLAVEDAAVLRMYCPARRQYLANNLGRTQQGWVAAESVSSAARARYAEVAAAGEADSLGRALALITLGCHDLGPRVATQLGLALHTQSLKKNNGGAGIFAPSVLSVVGRFIGEAEEAVSWSVVLTLPWIAPVVARVGRMHPWKEAMAPGALEKHPKSCKAAAKLNMHFAVLIACSLSTDAAADLAALGRWLQGSCAVTIHIKEWRARTRTFAERWCKCMTPRGLVDSTFSREWARIENATYAISSASWPNRHMFQPAISAMIAFTIRDDEVVQVAQTVVLHRLRAEHGASYSAAAKRARGIIGCFASQLGKGLPDELVILVLRWVIRRVGCSFWTA